MKFDSCRDFSMGSGISEANVAITESWEYLPGILAKKATIYFISSFPVLLLLIAFVSELSFILSNVPAC
jgi:hypothetical protein